MRDRALLLAALLSVVGVLASSAPAAADDAAIARFHHERAVRFFEQGRFEAALQEFFLEQQATQNPRTAYNIGRCFQELGRTRSAFLAFSEYLDRLPEDEDDGGARARAEGVLRQMAPRVARLRVVSDPPGATVYVGERDLGDYGTTPRLLAVRPGTTRIRVELPGHRPAQVDVEAVVGREEAVQLSLTPILGAASVSTVPSGVPVRLVDPAGQEVTRCTSPCRLEAPPGPYSLLAVGPGYREASALTRLRADEETTASLRLEELPAPTESLTVTANQRVAIVRIDGDPVGFAPLLLPSVVAGSHVISVEAQGMAPWEERFELSAGEPLLANATLYAPITRRHSPWTWGLLGSGSALFLGAGSVAIAALVHHRGWNDGQRDDADAYRERGLRLNRTADALTAVGAMVGAIGLVLFALERRRPQLESTGFVEPAPESFRREPTLVAEDPDAPEGDT
ncbi:MAG: PEGA domain-containing protein [Myxococcota bacterium]